MLGLKAAEAVDTIDDVSPSEDWVALVTFEVRTLCLLI